MKSSRPPVAAEWLLNHLAAAPENNSLAGDLTEEYARGRSRAWYWKQVAAAVIIGFWIETSSHKLLALRALFTGWTFLYLSNRFVAPAFLGIWWHFARHSQLAFQFLPLVLWAPILATAGWLVGRLHRTHHIAMIILFALSLDAWASQRLPWAYTLLLDSFSDTRYIPYLAQTAVGLVALPVSILIGGLLSGHESKPETSDKRVAT